MEEVKYIPGDLVMTNGVPLGTAKDVVYRVTSSDPSKTLELDDGTVLKGVVCLENIEGYIKQAFPENSKFKCPKDTYGTNVGRQMPLPPDNRRFG